MKTKGTLVRIEMPFRAKKPVVSFEVEASPEDVEQFQNMELDISFAKHRNHRSKDANSMLWACLGEMAAALGTDNWSMYLYELERYGQFTHILVRPDAIEAVKRQWRETKVVGETTVTDPESGKPRTMIEMICYYGSSTYNTKEFSRLLTGVIDDMKQIHLPPPPSSEMRRLLDEMEKRENDQTERQRKTRPGRPE